MAQLTAAELNNLPDSDFAYIEPGGTKDAEGKTVPRSLRHYAIHDEAHVRDALARAAAAKNAGGQTAEIAAHAMPKIEAAAKRMGIGEPAMRAEMPLHEGFLVRSMAPTITYADGETVRSVDFTAPEEGASGIGELSGRFAVFDTWAEVRSVMEGNFMERVGEGAFRKTLSESRPAIIFNHGWDPQIGTKPLAPTEDIGEDNHGGYYRGQMLDTSYNRDLIPGLRANLYGSSYRTKHTKQEVNVRPKPSGYNPRALPEVTVREIALKEVGPGMFPVYAGTSATVRSETDDYLLSRFGNPEQLHAFISAQQGPLALANDGAGPAHSAEASRSASGDAPTQPKRFRSRDEWLAYLKEQSRT